MTAEVIKNLIQEIGDTDFSNEQYVTDLANSVLSGARNACLGLTEGEPEMAELLDEEEFKGIFSPVTVEELKEYSSSIKNMLGYDFMESSSKINSCESEEEQEDLEKQVLSGIICFMSYRAYLTSFEVAKQTVSCF